MTNYREILRLSSLQYSQRTIESMAHCSRHTVRDVLQAAKEQGISWPLSDDITNAELEQLLFPNRHKASSQYAEPDYPYIHRELARSGVTLTLLWEEYCAKCQEAGQGHHIILKGASGNGKTYIACALGNAACRRFKKVQYIRMPELLDELSIARSGGTLKKVLEAYKKKDLLILDEWLIRPLSPQESHDMLEIVEARCHKSTIFCTQYESEGWYTRIDPNPESDSPVSEAIMDRIIHNAYEVLVDGRVSMRERKGLKAAREGGGQDV